MGQPTDVKPVRLLEELNTTLINYSQIFPKQKLDVSGGRESSLFYGITFFVKHYLRCSFFSQKIFFWGTQRSHAYDRNVNSYTRLISTCFLLRMGLSTRTYATVNENSSADTRISIIGVLKFLDICLF
jgi:hypothetical protein